MRWWVTPLCDSVAMAFCLDSLCCAVLRWQSSDQTHATLSSLARPLAAAPSPSGMPWDGWPAYETQVPKTAAMWRLHMYRIMS